MLDALQQMADAGATLLRELADKTDSRLDDQLVPLLRKAGKTFVAVLAFNFVGDGLRDAADPYK